MKNNRFISILIIVLALIIVAVLIKAYSKGVTEPHLQDQGVEEIIPSQEEEVDLSGVPLTQESLDASALAFFSNPELSLDSDYISPVDWPPMVRLLEGESYSCTPAGNEFERAGKTEQVIVDGVEYCVTTVSEGAAGSQYIQYAYLRDIDGTPVAATFSFRFVQCMNYDEPNQSVCTQEQSAFTITPVIHQFFSELL